MKYFTEDVAWLEADSLEEFRIAMLEDWGYSPEVTAAHLAAMDALAVNEKYVIVMENGEKMTITRLE